MRVDFVNNFDSWQGNQYTLRRVALVLIQFNKSPGNLGDVACSGKADKPKMQVDARGAMQIFRTLILAALLVVINGCAVIGVSYWPFSREIIPSKKTTLSSRRVCNIYYIGENAPPVKSKAELISSWGMPYQMESTNGIEKLTFNEKKRFWSGIGLWPVLFKIPLVWLPINRNACIVEIENDKIVGFSYYRQARDEFYGCGVYYDWSVSGAWRYGCGNDWGLDP